MDDEEKRKISNDVKQFLSYNQSMVLKDEVIETINSLMDSNQFNGITYVNRKRISDSENEKFIDFYHDGFFVNEKVLEFFPFLKKILKSKFIFSAYTHVLVKEDEDERFFICEFLVYPSDDKKLKDIKSYTSKIVNTYFNRYNKKLNLLIMENKI